MKETFGRLTVPETAVIVFVVLFVAMLAIPAGLDARGYGRQTVCLGNVHMLGRAWFGYAADNEDRIVNGHVPRDASYANTAYWVSRGYTDNAWWVDPPHNQSGVYSGELPFPLQDEQRGIETGRLFAYAGTGAAYHCPADKQYPVTGSTLRGGIRSYSVTGLMNGEDIRNPSGWVNVKKTGEMVSAGQKCLFVENTDLRGWNMGSWVMWNDDMWTDPLAIWHGDRSTLGFADGHAALHAWVDGSTLQMSLSGSIFYPINWNGGEGTDFLYMRRAYVPAEDIGP